MCDDIATTQSNQTLNRVGLSRYRNVFLYALTVYRVWLRSRHCCAHAWFHWSLTIHPDCVNARIAPNRRSAQIVHVRRWTNAFDCSLRCWRSLWHCASHWLGWCRRCVCWPVSHRYWWSPTQSPFQLTIDHDCWELKKRRWKEQSLVSRQHQFNWLVFGINLERITGQFQWQTNICWLILANIQ